MLKDLMENDIHFLDIMSNDVVNESIITEAFWEGHRLSQKARSVKSRCKEAKRLAKAGETDKAKKMYKEAISELEEIKKNAAKMPNDSAWDWVVRLCTISVPLNPQGIVLATALNLPHIVRAIKAYNAGEGATSINRGVALNTIEDIIKSVKKDMENL